MDDPELAAIRARRLQELQSQHGKGPGPGGMDMQEQQRAAQERQEKEEEFRNTILSQVLTQEARARLSNIALAKPEKAKMFENILIANVQRGMIRSKLSEEQFKHFLEQVHEQTAKNKTTVKYDRRKTAIDDSDDDKESDVDDDHLDDDLDD